jgi:outer membrane protein OmpA-like peptidoglycan-associated protein
MERRTVTIRLAVALVWIAFALGVAIAYRYLVSPHWKEVIQGTPELTASQWEELTSADARQIVFGRGSDVIDENAERILTELAAVLKSSPQSYVRVDGQARTDGDAAANQRLALQRAKAAADFLVAHGVNAKRVHASSKPSSGDGTQSVRFVIGEPLK